MIHKAFCMFCSLPINIYTKKHVSFLELFVFAFLSIIFTALVWNEFHFIGLFVFAVFAATSEFVHRMRWRGSVKCKGCGFDPVLYRSAPDLAATIVKDRLALRKQDPLYMLKPQPKIKPILRKVKKYHPPSKDLSL